MRTTIEARERTGDVPRKHPRRFPASLGNRGLKGRMGIPTAVSRKAAFPFAQCLDPNEREPDEHWDNTPYKYYQDPDDPRYEHNPDEDNS